MYRSVYNCYRLLDQLYRYSSIMAIIPRTKGIRKILGQPQKVEKTPETTKNIEVVPEVQNIAQNPPAKEHINLKAQYKVFKELVLSGKVTSAVLTARALNVDRKTLYNWKNKKEIQLALAKQLTKYVDRIEESKDYRASLDLIELIVPKEKENSTAIQVNTYIDERTALLTS